MKKTLLLLCILTAFNCLAQDAFVTNRTPIKYGALINGNGLTVAEKASVLKDSLQCNYVRTNIVVSQWNGSLPAIDVYLNKNLTVIANVSYYPTGSQHPFLTASQVQGYKDTLALIVAAYPQIKILCVNNEEFTQAYHRGNLDDYGLNELKATYEVAHPLGVLVADGGLGGPEMDMSTYRFVDSAYGRTEADVYAANVTMPSGQVNAARTPNSDTTLEKKIKKLDSVFKYNAYADIWMIHFYEPFTNTNTQADTITSITPNVFRYQKEFVESRTHKRVGTNEFGQQANNAQPLLTIRMIKELKRCGYWCGVYWSGVSSTQNTTALNDVNTGTLTITGNAYKNNINQ